MSSKSSYYLPGSSDIKNLPEPTWVCEDCGGGSWKKIKKGSDVEKYLKFCRCADAETADVVDAIAEEPVKPPPDAKEAEEAEDDEKVAEDGEAEAEEEEDDAEKPPEIPKHLRSRLKPKHHILRKWNHEASFISED